MQTLNWKALETLRSLFLNESDESRRTDYWETEEFLELYDQTFAQRIAWKWQAVLNELTYKHEDLNLSAPLKILDWGCGTGIASRTFLSHFEAQLPQSEVYVYDRSNKACQFAIQKIASEFPQVSVQNWNTQSQPTILLLSHILNEIDDKTLQTLKQLTKSATLTIWVEPGTRSISHKLIALREEFKSSKHILAPCPHQLSCPILKEENSQHWCHNFAEPPSEVFQSAFWSHFSRTLHVDLRSLATSFLILGEKPSSIKTEENRVLGRAKALKAHMELITCNQEGNLTESILQKRSNKAEFKRLSKTKFYQTYSS